MRNLNRVKKQALIVVLLIITAPVILLTSCSSGGGGSQGGSGTTVIIPPPGNSPDLDITNHLASPSIPLTPGQSFTLSVSVVNNGDVSPATILRYYRSNDRTVSSSDAQVGTDPVDALSTDGSSPGSISLAAPSTPGTYYYGACVDAVPREADPSNDCTESGEAIEVVVVNRPNLDIKDHSVDDSTLTSGQSFTLSVTVFNGGNASPATTLRYYRSSDTTISNSDAQVGADPVDIIATDGTSLESINLTAPSPGTYYYGACVDAVPREADPANDCTESGEEVQVVVDPANSPNLNIQPPPVTDATLTPGQSFTLSFTVANNGGVSPATILRYYRSSDRTIDRTDTEVGTGQVGAISADGTDSKSIDLQAPSSPGTYYYGACVDSVSGEADSSNNCTTTSGVVRVVVDPTGGGGGGNSPNLDITNHSVDDSTLTPGQSFTLSVSVANNGDPSPATTLRYYRSNDRTISSSDTQAGTDQAIGAISANGSSPESIDLQAPSNPGTYYYGACVDPVSGEADPSNDCTESGEAVEVVVANRPNLDITNHSVDDATLTPGQSFTLSITVANSGDPSPATILRYYRSSDTTISSTDTEVGTDPVDAISTNSPSPESIDLQAPSSTGTYYYGACVDPVSEETDPSNDCTASNEAVQVVVDPPSGGGGNSPNLDITNHSVDDSTLTPGQSFTLSVSVANNGDPSPATTLRYYRSNDRTISSSDTQAGTDQAIGAISANGSSPESIDLQAPSNPGTYYYGACVDPVSGEADPSNDCTESGEAVEVVVDPPSGGGGNSPNLDITNHSVDDSTLTPGQSFTLSVSVANNGDSSLPTTLRYYRSSDTTISSSDTQVGTDQAIGAISANGSSPESIDLQAPSNPGTYYYGACVDPVSGEADPSNDCTESGEEVQVVVRRNQPNLDISAHSVDDSTLTRGQNFTLSVSVANNGDAAPATTLRYYRSSDNAIDRSDTEVGTNQVGAIPAGNTESESIDLQAPSSPGTYYYGACVDPVSGEADPSNDCTESGEEVEVVVANRPNLDIQRHAVSNPELIPGQGFTLSVFVYNVGDTSPATILRYYRSSDNAIDRSDVEVGTDPVDAISTNAPSRESIRLDAPSPGTYYYGACVDAVPREADPSNDCTESNEEVEVVVAIGPNMDITNHSREMTLTAGENFTLSVTVVNNGGASPATILRYYRSSDTNISGSDTEVGRESVGALSANGASPESMISLQAPSSPGTYYYGACVNRVSRETDPSDDCTTTFEAIEVVVVNQPDLDIRNHSRSPTRDLTSGENFTLRVAVYNSGDLSPATTLRYYRSSDTNISDRDTQVGINSVRALSTRDTTSRSIRLTAPLSPGTYYYGACVDQVSGEVDSSNDCTGTSEAVRVVVVNQPDLDIRNHSVDDSTLIPSQNFTLSVSVYNRGDPSPATTLRYYRSNDRTISSSDMQVGIGSVPALSTRDTSPESISLTAPSPGTYYYGACVDIVPGETDSSNDCTESNEAVQVVSDRPNQPDLDVRNHSRSPTRNLNPGENFTLNVAVFNHGDPSPPTTLRYYRSNDRTISSRDTPVGTDSIGALGASRRTDQSVSLTASSPGTYYYGACVDRVSGESDPSDDCTKSNEAVEVVVDPPPSRPDLDIRNHSVSNSTPTTGQSFTLRVAVYNHGDPSPPTTLRYYRSNDRTISSRDTPVGTDSIGALGASSRIDYVRSLTAPSPGTYYYGACVDRVSGESDPSDDCTTSGEAVEVVVPPHGRVTWTIDDKCFDLKSLEFRLFWLDNGRNIGQTQSFFVRGQFAQTKTVNCGAVAGRVADKVCVGGVTGSTSFGLGLDGSSGCTNCCRTCTAGQTNSASFDYRCP